MGLIGGVLQTLYCNGFSTLMSPASFLQRPIRWLDAISRTQATISGGPNFAYDLCARKITDEQKAHLDLSRWSVAFNGAEPIHPETIDRFTHAFAPHGFRREAFLPCYGLAESTLMVTAKQRGGPTIVSFQSQGLEKGEAVEVAATSSDSRPLVSSGTAFESLRLEIVDPATSRSLGEDHVGEIWVSGPSVAQGYWNRQEPFSAPLAIADSPFLRTGDLGFLHHCELFVTGRLKDLMIIRGRNVYPQDIEWTAAAAHPLNRAEGAASFSVEVEGREALVVIQEIDRPGKDIDTQVIVSAIREAVAVHHDLDVHAIVLIRAMTLPKTSSGKVMRHACREAFLTGRLDAISTSTNAIEPPFPAEKLAPKRSGDIERWLVDRLAVLLHLDPRAFDVRRPFATYGLGSLKAVELAGELEQWLAHPLSPTLIYDYPTIESLAAHLEGDSPPTHPSAQPDPSPTQEPIAIIGIGCRFPGASGPEAFWKLLSDGIDAVGEPPSTRLLDGLAAAPRAGFLDRVDLFDAPFFGIAPREAIHTDPQHRLLLEVAWQALEDSGLVPENLRGHDVGVFVGIATNDYGRGRLGVDKEAYAATGNALSVAANRLSYVFDFRGPSLAVDTACSSSLVAVHLACESLRRGESTLALAGGVNVLLSPEITETFAAAGFLSPLGKCKTFDASADGYVRGEGAGLVVLKPLDRAIADGDPIYAVVRSSAVNQDGRSNGITAPNRLAQEAVIRTAYRRAGISASAVDYVEAHGTGTLLGDPIEAAALASVLSENRPPSSPCAIGSVKTNIGHLEAAGGVAGLIKVALALKHQHLPASLHFHAPNPHIPFSTLPIQVQSSAGPWPKRDRPSLAGVSAFGFGGTNAHALLESPPRLETESRIDASSSVETQIIPLSAQTPAALNDLASSFHRFLTQDSSSLADIAHTSAVRRSHHDHRLAIVAATKADAIALLGSHLRGLHAPGLSNGRRSPARRPRVAFIFSGQGSQWLGMGRGLAEHEPVFKQALDECGQRLQAILGWSVIDELAADQSSSRLVDTGFGQPVVFAIQVALAALWRSWGVVPDAVLGHSLGEVAAAHAAGAISLDAAALIVANRARLMQTTTGQGKTAALALSEPEAAALVAQDPLHLALACVNGPNATVVSGDPDAVDSLVAAVRAQGVSAKVLGGRCAFHGPQMDPLLAPLKHELSGIHPTNTSIPIVSSVTGQRIDGCSLDAGYWARNLRETVRFAEAAKALILDDYDAYLEIGPHPSLAPAILETLASQGLLAPALPSLRRSQEARESLRHSLAALYSKGVPLAWEKINANGRHCPLPAYPFQRERFWLDLPDHSPLPKPSRNGSTNGIYHQTSIDQSPLHAGAFEIDWQPVDGPTLSPAKSPGHWVIFDDSRSVAPALRARLEAAGARCTSVKHAKAMARLDANTFQGDTANSFEISRILDEISTQGEILGVISLASLDDPELTSCKQTLALIQALLGWGQPGRVRLWLATAGAQSIPAASRPISPFLAPIWGLGRSLALERPTLWGGLVDVDPSDLDAVAENLAAELLAEPGEDQVAYRSQQRFVARLVRRTRLDGLPSSLPLRPDGTYLITGGLGELGISVAHRLAEQGARRIVLVGRQAFPARSDWQGVAKGSVSARRVSAIQAIEDLGATVHLAAIDVADPEGVKRLFHDLQNLFPPIRGIIHAAGVVTAESLASLDVAKFEEVLRPKVAGTILLHEQSLTLPLDFFVMFSSVASILGAKEAHYAAANHFLDAFAHHRRSLGLPALSVNWGPWQGPGMAASADRTRAFTLLGIAPLATDDALDAMAALIASGASHALVADADWDALHALHSADGRRPLLKALSGHHPHRKNSSTTLPAWRFGPPGEARDHLLATLRSRLAQVLRTEPDRVEIDRPLNTLGLDSLMAIELKNGVESDLGLILPLASLLQGPTLHDLADRLLEDANRLETPPDEIIPQSSRALAGFPLSIGQQALWSLHQLDPSSSAYHVVGAVRVLAALDLDALHRSLQTMIDRHPSLRTTFPSPGGIPVQRIHDRLNADFSVEEASGDSLEAVTALLSQEAGRPFNLERGPLIRLKVFRVAEAEFALILAMHHIISDFWSISVLLDELGRLYPAEVAGEKPVLSPLPLDYRDFVAWQSAILEDVESEPHRAYWRNQLAGPLTTLTLPTDRPRPSIQTFAGASIITHYGAQLASRLTSLGEAHKASLFVTLLAGFQALLARYTGQSDVIVGVPVAGRTRAGFTGVVGYFVNTLPIRTHVEPSLSFQAFLEGVRHTVLGGLEHQDLPFPLIVESLNLPGDPSKSPVFQVMFVLQKAQHLDSEGLTPFVIRGEGSVMELGGQPVESIALDSLGAQFDITVMIAEDKGRLAVSANFNTDLFDAKTIERLLDHYQCLLQGAVDHPNQPISSLPLLTNQELDELTAWNANESPIPPDTCIHQLFHAQARKTPNAVAVSFEGRTLTYDQLNSQANQLARHLRSLGVGREALVGICVDRSPEMLVGLLGILKAGGAYVPLDPSFPTTRLAFMLADANMPVLLTQEPLLEALPEFKGTIVCLDRDRSLIAAQDDADLESFAGPDNLAYLIYTSGSTGKPKGVMIPHLALLNFILSMRREPGLSSADKLLAVTTLSFDIAALELFLPLIVGASVEILSRDTAVDGLRLARAIQSSGATVMQATPASWRLLLESNWQGSSGLKALCGGEPMTRDLANRLLDKVGSLWNLYGPTETTIWSTLTRVGPGEDAISIGRPIDNTRAYVLDSNLRHVPLGVTGELYLAGLGLARGYHARPSLTAERFLPDPFSAKPGAAMYQTGDLARHRPDGVIECLGRADTQVKIRGYRIELGEVESALSSHPAIALAAATAREEPNGAKRLVAHLVPRGQAPQEAELRSWLRDRLPDYMIPSAFVFLDAMPMTPNGKVDRRALPEPAPERAADAQFTPARNPLEQTLLSAWSEVLGREGLGIHDSFFEHGGHSLKAAQLLARIRETFEIELPLRSLFESPTVATLAIRIEASKEARLASEIPALSRADRNQAIPASFSQQRLWLIDRLEPGRNLYNIPAAVRLKGPLQVDALQRALDEVVRRHESLRTTFREVGGLPFQVVAPDQSISSSVVDLSSIPLALREAEAERRARDDFWEPFDLARGPLIRTRLYRMDEHEHRLTLTIHHVVSDAWSMGVLIRELSALYGAFIEQKPSPLPALRAQYVDYSTSQHRWLRGEALDRRLAFWREKLEGLVALDLPTDRPRPASPTGLGGQVSTALPALLVNSLRGFCREEGATVFMVALAGFEALLQRYSGQTDFAVGTPDAGRTWSETEDLIGFFVNTLVQRADLSAQPSLRTLVGRVRLSSLEAHAHGELPFERLVGELSHERDPGRAPLFQVMFVLQNAPLPLPEAQGLIIEPLDVPTEVSKFDLTLILTETTEGLTAVLEYSADLFDERTAARMLEHYETLLQSAINEPDRPLAELSILTDRERQDLARWNDTLAPFPTEPSFVQVFEATAAKAPESIAVEAADGSLTYRELNAKANQLARKLRAVGVGPEVRVGLAMERSSKMVTAIMAVLKAGGAYVPLDPEYPAERLAFLLKDSGAAVVVAESKPAAALCDGTARIVCLDDDREAIDKLSDANLHSLVKSENLAYVIYTSGTTGTPKGVLVTHGNLVHSTHARQLYYKERIRGYLLVSSFAFDSSVAGIFWTLADGGTLVLPPPGDQKDPHALAGLIARHKATHFLSVPSFYALMLETTRAETLASLRTVIVAGETCPRDLPARHQATLPGAELYNEYGPTEATVWATVHHCHRNDSELGSIPIGRPIANSQAFIFDAFMNPAPVGVSGELYLGGEGVARGYHGQPEQTRERFVEASDGGRLYRTGDLARWRTDGVIEYLGRVDGQVKIRGYRIELGEVEATLAEHPEVREAAAATREVAGETRLVGYIVPRAGSAPSDSEIRDWIKERLPEHLVPWAIFSMDALPLSPNGKVDRKALPEPEPRRGNGAGQAAPPRGPIEETLAVLWAEVLGVLSPGVHDDFFELGGHSLLAAQLAARVREAFAIDLPLKTLFDASTVATLAVRVAEAMRSGTPSRVPPLEPAARLGPIPASFAQQRLWFLDQLEPGSSAYNMPAIVRLTGSLQAEVLQRAFNELMRRHESLRTTFAAVKGLPVQVIAEETPLDLTVDDLTGLPERRREDEALRRARQVCGTPFDLAQGPLVRVRLYRINDQEHWLTVVTHHIVSDGWSVGVMVRELGVLYEAYALGGLSPLPEPTIQYADYAVWQRSWLQGETLRTELAYWSEALSGLPALELPLDRPRTLASSGRAGSRTRVFSHFLVESLRSLGRSEGATLYMSLLAGFDVLLHRYSGQTEFAIGSPIAGRTVSRTEGLIGFFVNTLALRADLSGEPTFRELLGRTKRTALGAFGHQDLPFERIVEELQPDREPGRSPVFQVLFVLQNAPAATLVSSVITMDPMEVEAETAKFDLTLSCGETEDGLSAALEYRSDLFDASTAERMLGHLERLLESAAAEPDRPVGALRMLAEAEQTALLSWNSTGTGHGNELSDDEDPDEALASLDDLSDDELDALINRI